MHRDSGFIRADPDQEAADAAPASSAQAPVLLLSELIGALSFALDLTEGQPAGHCLRCGWIGMQIGSRLGLDAATRSDLYYTLLLKDTGCSSNASRLWRLYGGDDRLVKNGFKTVDSQSMRQVARFVLRHTGAGEPLRRRIPRLLRVARGGPAAMGDLMLTRCERGADIVRRLGFSSAVAAGVYSLDEHWNGAGHPEGLTGTRIPLLARVALLAQVIDVFHAVGGPMAARAEAGRRQGTWFDPAVVAAFEAAQQAPAFWAGLRSDGLEARVAALEPAGRAIVVDDERLDTISEAFADVVDAKGSFTGGHSQRVARYADAIATRLQLSPAHRRRLRRAALLHDIGKLGVSNAILDKPGRLDADEWAAVRRHSALSEEILGRIGVFRDIAVAAGAHHERLDGTGYPRGLAGDAIPLEARIITAADIFDALSAERPYRGPMSRAEALALMERERGTAIDGACLDALKEALDDPSATDR
ncbi:MAG: HD domain-containing protein [Rhodospirillales bacterium]|nr:HD domain-containing protein [Rhodospirillales bacterium]